MDDPIHLIQDIRMELLSVVDSPDDVNNQRVKRALTMLKRLQQIVGDVDDERTEPIRLHPRGLASGL